MKLLKKISISKPSITDLEIKYVNDAISNGWGEKCYDYIHKLAALFSEYLKVKHSLPTSSGSGAIHLALAALGIKEGDEVIVPDLTWVATAAPIVWLGAKPVFADSLEDTWCISPQSIESKITPNTKAIIVVHLYGNLCEMDEILDIGKKYGIPILEDAAQALGSEYKGQKAGSMGLINMFSFHGTKTMTTSEGGIITTNDSELFHKISVLNDHGRDAKKSTKMFWMDQIGYKYKISNLAAALGCAQIERIQALVDKKREIFYWYKDLFKNIPSISINLEKPNTFNSYWMPNIIINDINFDRDKLFEEFKSNNIDSRPFFYPLSTLPMFEKDESNKIAYSLYNKGVNLPTNFDLTFEDAQFVVNTIKNHLKIQ